jgi:UDP-N-acetylmuramoyl-L-alanyl-D-glutamate--2,6-diaminopimelate ligase
MPALPAPRPMLLERKRWSMVPLSKLLSGIDLVARIGSLNVPIKGITDDSREVKDGYAFVCMPAVYESQYARWVYSTDGHDYIPDAIERGAATIISQNSVQPGSAGILPASDRVTFVQVQDARCTLAKMAAEFYGNPSSKLMVVGVTGTNGKTSTCYLARSVLAAGKLETAVLGTITHRVAGSDTPAGMTTPEAHRLQKMLSDAVEESLDGIVMEVSSHALELKRIDGTEFDVAVFTNLTQDHLDFHKDMAGYLAAKTRLFSELMKDSKQAFAIVNVDDPAGEHIIRHTDAEVITYAVHSEADVKVRDFRSSAEGVTFRTSIRGHSRGLKVKLQLLGEYNLYNALAAIGVGVSQGVDLDAIREGLESVDLIPGRFERVTMGQDYTVVVDYAHTPDALERALHAAKKIADGRLITVFGCGGDRDKGKRPLMGSVATALSDYSIITSDNPRSEAPMEIIAQIQSGIDGRWSEGQRYELIPDRRSAIQKAIGMAEKGDIVVIAGKGHENYQILKGGRIHFDDREVACESIHPPRARGVSGC